MNTQNSKTIQCPLYGNISVGPIPRMFIDTPEFQRLHDIKQTGMCYKVFPSATHSRFMHSIGTYYLSCRLLSKLQHTQSQRDILLIQLAALLHDIGHGPFSHVFEHIIQTHVCSDWTHEQQTIRIIHHMVTKYNIPLTPYETEQVCKYIDPPETHIQHWMYQIVSNKYNSIDVDKLDYLQRDMLVMGLYSKIPTDRILMGMHIHKNQIMFRNSVTSDIADLLFQRFRMYRQIYQHRVVVACDVLVEHIVTEVPNLKSYIDNIELFLQLNDQTIMFISNNTTAQHILHTRTFERTLGKQNKKITANIVGHCCGPVQHILKKIHLTDGTTLFESTLPQVRVLSSLNDTAWL